MINRKYTINDAGKLVKRISGVPVSDDVPTFILLASDVNALPTIMSYRMICKDLEHTTELSKATQDFDNFRKQKPDRMKEPD